jgi:hypothetical protein
VRSAPRRWRRRRAEPAWWCAEPPWTVTRGTQPRRSPPPRPRGRRRRPRTWLAHRPPPSGIPAMWAGGPTADDVCARFRSPLSSWSQARLARGGLAAASTPETGPRVRAGTVSGARRESHLFGVVGCLPRYSNAHTPLVRGAWACSGVGRFFRTRTERDSCGYGTEALRRTGMSSPVSTKRSSTSPMVRSRPMSSGNGRWDWMR